MTASSRRPLHRCADERDPPLRSPRPGDGRPDRRDRPRRRAVLSRVRGHQPRHRRELDGGRVPVPVADLGRARDRGRARPRAGGHASSSASSSRLVVFRPLRSSSPLSSLVASLGVLLTAQATIDLILKGGGSDKAPPSALDVMIGGGGNQIIPSVLPQGLVTMFGARIPADRFWLTGIVVLAAAVLWALYRWSHFGLATRAASENGTQREARRPAHGPPRAPERRPGRGGRRRHGDPRGRGDADRHREPAAAGRARPGRGDLRALHVLLDHLPRGAAHRRRAVAPVLRADEAVVPHERRRPAAGRQLRADVPRHRRGAVAAGIEPADAWRAARGASAARRPGPRAWRVRRSCASPP